MPLLDSPDNHDLLCTEDFETPETPEKKRKRRSWEPFKGEVFPLPMVPHPVRREKIEENVRCCALCLLDLEASVVHRRMHPPSLDLSKVLCSLSAPGPYCIQLLVCL
jgi:hypothetical protein